MEEKKQETAREQRKKKRDSRWKVEKHRERESVCVCVCVCVCVLASESFTPHYNKYHTLELCLNKKNVVTHIESTNTEK